MITQEHRYRIAQLRELARACTYDTFYNFLERHDMIDDESDGEWVDFSFGNGITSCICFDTTGKPYLSDYVRCWDAFRRRGYTCYVQEFIKETVDIASCLKYKEATRGDVETKKELSNL